MACPHRVLMGDPQVPFDYRHEPSNLNFNPTVPWLLAHNFGGEITWGRP